MLQAGGNETREAAAALETLCRAYWYPVYAFLRRGGQPPAEAQDLTQGFFAGLLDRKWLHGVGPDKGLFRTYLLRCLSNYLANEWHKERGPRRWPAGGIVPLETQNGEARYVHELPDNAAPDLLYQRRWVEALLDQVRTRLRSEYRAAGRETLFDQLEPHLEDRAEAGVVPGIATALGMTAGAVRVALHRLRHRFGELLRETVAQTLADPSQVDAEIRSLFSAWT